jgi:hypothetical protein
MGFWWVAPHPRPGVLYHSGGLCLCVCWLALSGMVMTPGLCLVTEFAVYGSLFATMSQPPCLPRGEGSARARPRPIDARVSGRVEGGRGSLVAHARYVVQAH